MPFPRPAVLLNPLSGRVRRDPTGVRALARRIGGDRYAEASEPDAMGEAVEGFDLAGDDVLCVVSGDGTLHAVLTWLERRRPEGPWPILAAVPAGTTNLTARDLSPLASTLPWMQALRNTPGRLVTRPVLRIGRRGADPLVGLFFGAGTVSAGVDFFNSRLRPRGVSEAVGFPAAIARTLLTMAVGGQGLDRMAPSMSLRVEGGPELEGPTVFLLASPLHRLLFGSHPYWGDGRAPIHLTAVERSAAAIFRSIPRLALGRADGRLTPERGWHSHDTSRVELAFDGPYIVDGELYHARGADGALELTAERVVRWWVP